MFTVEPPPSGGKGVSPFPALVPGAGTLPVGFQGRSALVAEGEIPGASWLLTGDKIAGFYGLLFIPV